MVLIKRKYKESDLQNKEKDIALFHKIMFSLS